MREAARSRREGAAGPLVATMLKVKLPYVGVCPRARAAAAAVVAATAVVVVVASVLMLAVPPRHSLPWRLAVQCLEISLGALFHEKAKGRKEKKK